VVAGAGTVADGAGRVVVVEEADTVVAFCVVDDWLVSLTGVGCVDPLEPLHADMNSITATPVDVIVDVIRMIHSLPLSSLTTFTVRTAQRAEALPQVSGQPEL
jgi:hypothetical protein